MLYGGRKKLPQLHLSVVIFFLVLRDQWLQYIYDWEYCSRTVSIKHGLQFSYLYIGLVALEGSTFTRIFVSACIRWNFYFCILQNIFRTKKKMFLSFNKSVDASKINPLTSEFFKWNNSSSIFGNLHIIYTDVNMKTWVLAG